MLLDAEMADRSNKRSNRADHAEARLLRDPFRAFADRGGIEMTFREEPVPELRCFGFAADMSAGRAQRPLELVPAFFQRDKDTFVGTQDGIVERLAVDDSPCRGV